MKEFTYTITDPIGIHARPAGLLAKKAKAFESEITLTKGEKTVNVTRLMALMGMGIVCGDEVKITVNGADEEAAAAEIEAYFRETL